MKLTDNLTRKQREIFNFLINNQHRFVSPPTLDELCLAMNLKSRGSLHKHIQGLIDAGLVKAPERKQRGVRLTEKALAHVAGSTPISETDTHDPSNLTPYFGAIAAGKPIEAMENVSYMTIPDEIKTQNNCYILKVKGDSMVDAGIFDGDWVIIEQRSHARNGECVVALIDKADATLKYIEQHPHQTVLIPANKNMQPMIYHPQQVEIQGVLVGQMRSYK